eukprot:scaffold175454_cov15-Tisochrysis_lutea.AAC.1
MTCRLAGCSASTQIPKRLCGGASTWRVAGDQVRSSYQTGKPNVLVPGGLQTISFTGHVRTWLDKAAGTWKATGAQ